MIHYHGTPFSGAEDSQMALAGKHAFVTYAYPKHAALTAEICQSFAIDNGAFSAWNSGSELDVEGFGEFLMDWYYHPAFDWYVMPDVIGGDHHANAAMRARWFKAVPHKVWSAGVPVWHLHEPIEVLRDLANAFSRVALGSSGQYATVGTQTWWGRMAEAMEVVTDDEGKPQTKLHGLRMLDPTVFSHIPLASADSTNVARNCGIDKAWNGPYAPSTRYARALVMMDRIERHASASRWNAESSGIQKNMELFG